MRSTVNKQWDTRAHIVFIFYVVVTKVLLFLCNSGAVFQIVWSRCYWQIPSFINVALCYLVRVTYHYLET